MLLNIKRNVNVRLLIFQPVRNIQSRFWRAPLMFDENEPLSTRRPLRIVEKEPPPDNATASAGKRHKKMPRAMGDIRGTERTHDKLIHKQFGIQALSGGQLVYGHYKMITAGINHHLDEKYMFAIWRVDAPWKAISKKATGARMGGGKGNVHHFATPVKKGRIVVEIGGQCEFDEVRPFLKQVAGKLPFEARPVSQEMLLADAEEQRLIDERNINPFTFEYCARNNFFGCQQWLSPYDWMEFKR